MRGEGGMYGRGSMHGRRGGGRAWQERRPLQRAVRILLEYILVEHKSTAVTNPLLICSLPVYLPI